MRKVLGAQRGMKLTFEQLFEVFAAMHWGREEAWRSSATPEQLRQHLESNRKAHRDLLAGAANVERDQQAVHERNLRFVDQPEAAEQLQREQFLALRGRERSQARTGLRQGINDLLHLFDAGYFPLQTWEIVDRRLAAHGLPRLDELLVQFAGRHRTILKRGRISNDEEMYLVQEILADSEFDVTEEKRREFGRMVAEFEQVVARRQKTADR